MNRPAPVSLSRLKATDSRERASSMENDMSKISDGVKEADRG